MDTIHSTDRTGVALRNAFVRERVMRTRVEIDGINTVVLMNDGNEIPLLGFGVWESKDGPECINAVDMALQCGYRHIDTAPAYENEASVGTAIRDSGIPRADIFVTTKYARHSGPCIVKEDLQNSLEKLKTDYLDLYLIHWPTGAYHEAWEFLVEMKEKGVCRSIGVSNFTIRRFEEDFFPFSGVVPVVNQVETHVFNQQRDLRNYCEEKDILIEAYSPLARAERLDDPVLMAISREVGKSPAQVMIRYLLQNGVIAIPKSANAKRIKENADVFDFELSPEQMDSFSATNDENYYSLRWRPEGFF